MPTLAQEMSGLSDVVIRLDGSQSRFPFACCFADVIMPYLAEVILFFSPQ